jgi:Ca-activated chloride channel family protein
MQSQVDRPLIRARGGSRRHWVITLAAPAAQTEGDRRRKPVNAAVVLDRSGSMAGGKILLAREAARKALSLLASTDRFSLVAYDHEVDVLVPSTIVGPETLDLAFRRLEEVEARGATNLGSGWLTGCEQVAQHLGEESVGKCLLLTDGLANAGITGAETLAHHARELRQRGVLTSTFGIGRDFDERLLESMATQGGGNFYYVEAPAQIPDFLASEMGETLEVVARDVRLQVAAPPGVEVRLLSDYPTQEAGSGLVCLLSSLVARQGWRWCSR